MKIAIIDSGVNPGHPHVAGVAGGVSLTAAGESADYFDRLGHGTAVAGAIREKAPDAELYAVKVFDRTLACKIDVIIRALEWAMAEGMDVINLSLGTSNQTHRARFENVLGRRRGAVVVSAFEQRGRLLFPGSLDGVIGVTLDAGCPREKYRVEWHDGRALFCAAGFPRSIPGVPQERNLNGISFAVANMTGFVARELARGTSRDLLVSKLIEHAAESRVTKGVLP